MPPEDNVRSWAMVKYYSILSLLLGYPMLASQVYTGFQPYMKVDKEIKAKAAEITAGATTDDEKLQKIFDFVRTNIKNTQDENSGFTEDQIEKLKENKKPSDTLKRGVGPGIDINLLFAALANAAGLEARVALLPDRGQRLFERDVHIPGALRPSNIAVRSGTSWKFFDPGLQYITPGMLRWQEEGVDALIADERPIWTRTPLSPPEKSKEKRVATFKLDENGTLEGDVTVEYTGHLAVERKRLNDEDSPAQREENLKEMVKTRLSSAELTNIVIENATDPVKPFVYKYHVRIPEYAQRTGKRLFFQPAYFHKGVEPMFSAGTRRYPIYFHYPWSEDDEITIRLPKGYALDNADRPAPINAGISKHEVHMGISNDQTTLHYSRSFFFGQRDVLLFNVDKYELLKRLFDEISKADNHMITLKQVGSTN
jgi:Transglutaminase-like superfamily